MKNRIISRLKKMNSFNEEESKKMIEEHINQLIEIATHIDFLIYGIEDEFNSSDIGYLVKTDKEKIVNNVYNAAKKDPTSINYSSSGRILEQFEAIVKLVKQYKEETQKLDSDLLKYFSTTEDE